MREMTAAKARRFALLAYRFAQRAGLGSYATGEARAAWADAARAPCNSWNMPADFWAHQWAESAKGNARRAAREARAIRQGQGSKENLLEALRAAARAGGFAARHARG